MTGGFPTITAPLATAYPSEGIPDEAHALVWWIYAIAIAMASIGVVMRLQDGWHPRTRRRMAAGVLVVGLVPVAWHLRIYLMDFVPREMDGTPASPPVWEALAIPCIPAFCGLILLLAAGRTRRSGHPPITEGPKG